MTIATLLAACTGAPPPAPAPTPAPDETAEPSPSGVQVAVVMPPPDDPAAASFLDAEGEMADLEEDRVGDVARVRVVVPDDVRFVPDVAALLADEGADLVCILGSDGARTALTLADRFPATRFCALATPREVEPTNVELFDVAHEELGHVLGVAVTAATSGAPLGIVRGDDADERVRRRAGARVAMAGDEVVADAVARDADEAEDLAEALADVSLTALIVDVADPAVATTVAATARTWVGPRGVAIDESAGAALVRWSLRTDVIVGWAVDRLVGNDVGDEPVTLGFPEDVFALTFADGVPDAVRAATEGVADEFRRGARDPLGGPTEPAEEAEPEGTEAPDAPADPPAERPAEQVD